MKDIYLVTYSPTHTSETIAREVGQAAAAALSSYTLRTLDLTPSTMEKEYLLEDCIAIFAAPVYGGRLAEVAARRFSKMKGHRCWAIPVVLYGNRDYEDALLELSDLVTREGFDVIAGGAFIGEHSYSREGMPVAQGRPDPKDREAAARFGAAVAAKLKSTGTGFPEMPMAFMPTLKGNRPYKFKSSPTPQAPVCNQDLCIRCGRCASACPVDAITITEEGACPDPMTCTKCCACIRQCPVQALTFDTPYTEMLFKKCSERKEPETFL